MKIRCPSCSTQYRVENKDFGRTTKCRDCGQEFRIPKPATNTRRVEIRPGTLGPSVSYDCGHCGQSLLSSCSNIGELNACPRCTTKQMVPGAKQYELYIQDESERTNEGKLQELRDAEMAVAKLRAELAPVTTEEFLNVNGFLPIVPPSARGADDAKTNLQFLPSIPKDYCIFKTDIEITGLWSHQHAVHQYLTATEHGVCLVPEPNNRDDKNSIAAYGVIPSASPGKPLTVQIGYLPRDDASQIARSEVASVIVPRLRHIWSGGKRSAAVKIDLLGPRAVKPRFDEYG